MASLLAPNWHPLVYRDSSEGGLMVVLASTVANSLTIIPSPCAQEPGKQACLTQHTQPHGQAGLLPATGWRRCVRSTV